ncbi:MAG: hypothetical protein JXR58_02570 [Bacteroidales bacterium]|nr:hypothetical protein [Bacteroidales bacterium]
MRTSAQDSIDYAFVNNKTYEYYLQGNWDEIIKLGKKAIKNDIDYYYLRMRLGIALYEKGNYLWAKKHFDKARSFNSGDTTINYYLYSIYRNTGNYKTALFYEKKLSDSQLDYLQIPKNKPFVSGFAAEMNIFSNPSFNSQLEVSPETLFPNSKKTITNNFTNTYIYLNHLMGKRLSYSHAITFLSLSGQVLSMPPIMPTPPPLEGYLSDEQKVKQTQYYGKFSLQLAKRSNFGFGIHSIGSSTESFRGRGARMESSNTRERNFVKFLSFTQGFSIFQINGFLAKSNLNLEHQTQFGAGLTILPFGNLNQYLFGEFSSVTENDSIQRQIIRIKAGSKIYRNLWLEGSLTIGEIMNYLESDGLLVYNNTSTILSKTEITLYLYRPKNKIQYYLRYSLNKNRGDGFYEKFEEDAPIEFQTPEPEIFNTNTFTGGIKWQF